MKQEIFAVDFDGTLCENAWPNIGKPCHDMINWVKQLRQNGHKLILWTCRSGMALVDAIVWCADHGLFFDAVNDNLEEHKQLFGGNSRKILADFYIDDKAVYPSVVPFMVERSMYEKRKK
jgi:hydroxymethylpyrimidine pyrophosphatase-like HAD family hydrolase